MRKIKCVDTKKGIMNLVTDYSVKSNSLYKDSICPDTAHILTISLTNPFILRIDGVEISNNNADFSVTVDSCYNYFPIISEKIDDKIIKWQTYLSSHSGHEYFLDEKSFIEKIAKTLGDWK